MSMSLGDVRCDFLCNWTEAPEDRAWKCPAIGRLSLGLYDWLDIMQAVGSTGDDPGRNAAAATFAKGTQGNHPTTTHLRVILPLALLLAAAPLHAAGPAKDAELEARITAMGKVHSSSAGQYSPDGKQIAFITTISGSPQARVMPASGGTRST